MERVKVLTLFLLIAVNMFLHPTIVSGAAVSKEDLQSYIEDVVAQYKVNLRKKAINSHAATRSKRSVGITNFANSTGNSTASLVYESQISEIIPFATVPSVHPVEIEPFRIENNTYLAVVNFKDAQGNYKAESAIFSFNGSSTVNEVQKFATSGAVDFEYVDTGTQRYAVFLDFVAKDGGVDTYKRWFQLNQFIPERNSSKPFHYRNKVLALGAKRVKVFMNKNGLYFFLTANSYFEQGARHRVKSTMHIKLPYGFEIVQQFDTMGAQDVEVAVIDGVRYVFFVNHQDNSGDTDIYSFVYKEKESHELTYTDNYAPYGLYQRILTHGGRDFEVFSFRNNHYLVAVNEYSRYSAYATSGSDTYTYDYEVDSVIYWWTGKLWVEWQRIPTNGALKATYFTSDYGDPMLVIANSKQQATIYTYDYISGVFKQTTVQGLNPLGNNSFIPDVRSVSVFKAFNETFMAVANYALEARAGYNIFKIKFERNATESTAQSTSDMIKDTLSIMKEELLEVKDNLDDLLLRVTQGVLTKSSDQAIQNLQLNGDSTINNLKTASMTYTDYVMPNPVKEMAEQAALLRTKVQNQESNLAALKLKLEDSILLDTASNITGKKTFAKALNFTSNLEVSTATLTGTLDGVNITELDRTLLKADHNQTITGKYDFRYVTSFDQSIEVTGTLNNIRLDDILTVNTDQIISGVKTFQDTVTISNENLEMEQFTINGVNMSSLMLKDKDQTVTGHKTYNRRVQFSNVTLQGLLDGVNMANFAANKVSLSGNDVINGLVTFKEGFHVSSDVEVGGYVDNVNLTWFVENLNNVDKGDDIITGSKIFEHIYVQGHCKLESTINEQSLQDLAKLSATNTFTGSVVFDQQLIVKEHVLTSAFINGIHLKDDLVTINSSKTINGFKTFKELILHSDLAVHGNVNGVNLTQWSQDVVRKDSARPVTGRKTFNNIQTDNLVTETLNEINLVNLTTSILFLNQNETINMSITFEDVNSVKDLSVDGTMNGHTIPDDFVALNDDQTITGTKEFSSNQTIYNVLTVDSINDQNFTEFMQNAVTGSGQQYVYSEVDFEHDVYFTQNLVVDYINGINVSELVTLNTAQNLSGWITLTQDTVFNASVIADNVILLNNATVNGIDISVMDAEAIYKNRNETINGSIVFVDGIDCKQNLSVAGLINGVNLTELIQTTVRISKDQDVTGAKRFTSDFTLEDALSTEGTINNVDLQQLDENVLKTTSPQVINGNVTFESTLVVDENLNTTTINHNDIQNFLDTEAAIAVNGTVHINGSLTAGNVTIDNIFTDTINNISLSNVLLQDVNQTFSGDVEFENVLVDNVTTEYLNNISIDDVDQRCLKVDTDQNVTATYTFTNLTVLGNVQVTELNGVNVDEFVQKAVSLDGNATILGHLTLTEPVNVTKLYTSRKINNFNVSLLGDVLLKTSNSQTVCYKKEFLSELLVNNATFSTIQENLYINNVNISYINENGVKLSIPQTLNGVFHFTTAVANKVIVDTVNGFDMQSDFLSTTNNQSFSGNITFETKLEIESGLKVSGLIDGVNLTQLSHQRISYTDNVTVYGRKSFTNITANQIQLSDSATINNILPELLVTVNTTTPVNINGLKSFATLLVENLNVTSGFVNGVDLTTFYRDYMKRTDSEHTLIGDQTFLQNLTIMGNLTVEKLVNNQLVSGTHNYSTNIGDVILEQLNGLSGTAGSLCSKISSLMVLTATGSYLEGVEVSSSIDLPAENLGALDSTIMDDVIYISIARASDGGCGPTYILECASFPQCTVLQSIVTNAEELEFFIHNNESAVFVANTPNADNITTDCKNISEIYTWSTSQRLFIPSQTVNEELLATEDAPVLHSKGLLKMAMKNKVEKENNGQGNAHSVSRRSLNDQVQPHTVLRRSVGIQGNGNQNSNSRRVLKHVEKFSNGKNGNKRFVVASGSEDSGGFVEIYHGNGSTVGSLQRKQKIIVNSQRKNFVSVGKLKGDSVLTISSKQGKDMKLYKMNPVTDQFELYQQLPESATSVKFQDLETSEYLLFASPEEGFGLCPWLGVSGYQDCTTLQSTDNKYVETITTADGAYVVLGKPDRLDIYRIVLQGNGKKFEADVC